MIWFSMLIGVSLGIGLSVLIYYVIDGISEHKRLKREQEQLMNELRDYVKDMKDNK